MQKHYPDIRLFLWAAGISLLGSLPPGTLNVSAANLTIHKGLYGAIQFSAGVILVEVIMVRIALVAVKKVEGWFYNLFSLLGAFVIIIMALVSLNAAFHEQPPAIPFTGQKLFLSGLLLSLLNPFHLPFWLGWTAVLKSKRILTEGYNVYVIAIGAGTTLAFTAYILAGSFLIRLLKGQQHILNGAVGIVLLITGLVQLYKTFKLRRNFPIFVSTVSHSITLTKSLMTTKESFITQGENLLKKVKELIEEGNIRKITITDKAGKEIMSFPLTFGLVGALLAPVLAAVGAAAALIGECTITVEREEDPKKEA